MKEERPKTEGNLKRGKKRTRQSSRDTRRSIFALNVKTGLKWLMDLNSHRSKNTSWYSSRFSRLNLVLDRYSKSCF
eukprot:11647078-Karenia_brevis.AAC.1